MNELLTGVENNSIAKTEALLNVLGNPLRLAIIALLSKADKMTVYEMLPHLDNSYGNVIACIFNLRQKGVIISVKGGREMNYTLANPKLKEVFDVIKTCFPESRK